MDPPPSLDKILFALFAATAIFVDQIRSQPESLHLLNNVIVVVSFVALLTNLYRQKTGGQFRLLRIGGLAFFILGSYNQCLEVYRS